MLSISLVSCIFYVNVTVTDLPGGRYIGGKCITEPTDVRNGAKFSRRYHAHFR